MVISRYYCVEEAEPFSFEKEKKNIHYSNSYNGLALVLMQIGVLINLTIFLTLTNSLWSLQCPPRHLICSTSFYQQHFHLSNSKYNEDFWRGGGGKSQMHKYIQLYLFGRCQPRNGERSPSSQIMVTSGSRLTRRRKKRTHLVKKKFHHQLINTIFFLIQDYDDFYFLPVFRCVGACAVRTEARMGRGV